MSANAGIKPGHALTSSPNPPTPFVPGDPLFNVVTTAVPYQALVGDFVLTTDTSVTTPVGPTAGEYFAVKNVGVLTVTIVGTVDGAAGFTIPPSLTPAAQESVWFVWNATGATWEVVSGYERLLPLSIDTVAGTTYNFALTDANVRLKSFTNTAAKAATVLNQATVGWKPGTVLRGLNFGTGGVAGNLTLVAGPGVTIQRPKTFNGGIYTQFQLAYLGTDIWVLSGQPLFTTVNVAAPYQALAGDLVLTTSTAVTTPVSPVDGDYFAVKNVGSNSVTITGSVDGGAYVLAPSTLSGAQHAVWFVWNATSATWRIVAEYNPVGPYHWIWADAPARMAQAVTVPEIGFIGFQQDIALEYKLMGTSPTRWGPIDPPGLTYPHFLTGNYNSGTISNIGLPSATPFGALAARLNSSASFGQNLVRTGIATGAGAGSIAVHRAAGANFTPAFGYRWRSRTVLGLVSASMRWFAGQSGTLPATNVDPNTFLNSFGIGRGSEANVQLYHNDAAGLAVQIDLGASFPAVTQFASYQLDFFTADGTSYGWQVTNMATGFAVSGVVVAEIQLATSVTTWVFYASNNADATIVSIDLVDFTLAQRLP